MPPRRALAAVLLLLGLAAGRAGAIAPPIGTAPAVAGGGRLVADIAYGDDPRQRLDVYLPTGAFERAPADPATPFPPAPVLFLVHGGGWRLGDKAMPQVAGHKVAHFTSRGWIVVSANYRLLPQAPVAAQLQDVARALAFVQQNAGSWHGDPHRLVLMGHSAGAHLVGWLAAGGQPASGPALAPWRGTVLLDSAVMDVPTVMRLPHLPLYDAAFGRDPAAWTALSPAAQLSHAMPPILLVCSSRRRLSCPLAEGFAQRARDTGTPAQVLRQDRSHEQVNDELGLPGDYTDAVDRFVDALP